MSVKMHEVNIRLSNFLMLLCFTCKCLRIIILNLSDVPISPIPLKGPIFNSCFFRLPAEVTTSSKMGFAGASMDEPKLDSGVALLCKKGEVRKPK